jgi:hypothetical protein
MRRSVLLASAVSLLAALALAQDSPSLGDLARQQREQKAQSKAIPGKSAKAPKLITNENLPRHTETPSLVPVAMQGSSPAKSGASSSADTAKTATADAGKQSADDIRLQIQQQKTQVASLQAQITTLSDSIQFAPPNCVENCVQWNEAQKQKQAQVENMKLQLEDATKHLEQMQESARKQGYGSSVYDPE